MHLNDKEVWAKVVELKDQTLFTYVEHESNTISLVEDNNKKTDRVIILERDTFPTREDITTAYKLMLIRKELNRKTDLEWLAHPSKKVSSIVFRIIGEISKCHTRLDLSKREPVIILL